MTDTFTVDFEPLGRRARVVHGATLLEAARQAGVGLNAICGGAGTCGTCRVRVLAGQVTPATEAERDAAAEGDFDDRRDAGLACGDELFP